MIRFLFLVSLPLFFICSYAHADNGFPLIREAHDTPLQDQLDRVLKSLDLTEAAQKRKLGIALVDITQEDRPIFAGVNGDHMMYAASLPKIVILFGLFKRIEEGSLTWNQKNQDLAYKMIRESSNRAATLLYRKVGPRYIIKLLQDPRYKLYEKGRGGGLWMGKEYGKGRAFRRDPLHNLSHGATPIKVARFFYLLETNRLVSSPWAEKMKAVFSDPAIKHKFVEGLSAICSDAEIYRKSGTWRTFHSDAAIVEHDGKKYIAVALANDSNGGKWLPKIIIELDRLVFVRSDLPWACDPQSSTTEKNDASQ